MWALRILPLLHFLGRHDYRSAMHSTKELIFLWISVKCIKALPFLDALSAKMRSSA
jgi:hypothetical protein